MLVLDVADYLLDHVLDRDQPLCPAEFVDDDREMDALRPHPGEKIDDAHRFGDEQGLAKQCIERTVASLIVQGDENILDVDHADHLVEAIAVDRKPAVLGVGERPHKLVEADRGRHRDDIASSDANVARRPLAEVKQVAEHLALGRSEVAGDRPFVLGFVDRILEPRAPLPVEVASAA